jgi:hypothetical protein
MSEVELETEWVQQLDHRLGRHLVHDPRSKDFRAGAVVEKSQWRSKYIKVFDPSPNPDQCHNECTGCAKAMEFNTQGNRVSKTVLNMDNAHEIYHLASTLDPFDGSWPPDDTGSSGLASAKAARKLGLGGAFSHVFNGADGVVELIQQGRVVNIGTWWYEGMFKLVNGVIVPSGQRVGGHQYIARGYDAKKDMVIIRCWWGKFRDAKINRNDLHALIMDGGDAHIQDRVK